MHQILNQLNIIRLSPNQTFFFSKLPVELASYHAGVCKHFLIISNNSVVLLKCGVALSKRYLVMSNSCGVSDNLNL
jgi:hypothetical protein